MRDTPAAFIVIMEQDEQRVNNENGDAEKEEDLTPEESVENGEDAEREEEKEEKREPSPPPPPPAATFVNNTDHDPSVDPIDSLCKVKEEYESNKVLLDTHDFHSFPERCDLKAMTERTGKTFSIVQERVLVLKNKLEDTAAAVHEFNKSLERKIKDDSLDSWIEKDKINHSGEFNFIRLIQIIRQT